MNHPIAHVAGMLLLAASLVSAVEIIAHRGASHDAPENTMASFRLGYEQQADADELDIHLTGDGRIVVIHDKTTKRTAGLDKPVVEQTLMELQSLDAGAWKGPRFKGEKLPTLGPVLQIIPPGKKLLIEIKCGPEILPALSQALRQSGKKPEQLVLIGFNYDTMAAAKKQFPHLQNYWLVSGAADKKTRKQADLGQMIAKAKAAGLDGLNLEYKFPIDKAYAHRIHAAGLKFYTWTVDDPEVARKLVQSGVDGITTNRPGWLREQLKAAR